MSWLAIALRFAVDFAHNWLDRRRREKELRDAGAARERAESLRAAERQEIAARRAGDMAADEADDPRDLRKD